MHVRNGRLRDVLADLGEVAVHLSPKFEHSPGLGGGVGAVYGLPGAARRKQQQQQQAGGKGAGAAAALAYVVPVPPTGPGGLVLRPTCTGPTPLATAVLPPLPARPPPPGPGAPQPTGPPALPPGTVQVLVDGYLAPAEVAESVLAVTAAEVGRGGEGTQE